MSSPSLPRIYSRFYCPIMCKSDVFSVFHPKFAPPFLSLILTGYPLHFHLFFFSSSSSPLILPLSPFSLLHCISFSHRQCLFACLLFLFLGMMCEQNTLDASVQAGRGIVLLWLCLYGTQGALNLYFLFCFTLCRRKM